jgi:hemerythrin-like domain-containing protein
MANVMKPYGPLMVEHRLIEQIVSLMKAEIDRIDNSGSIDPRFIGATVKFLRIYADKCHHGKEEDLLFAALRKKEISDDDSKILDRLMDDHTVARQTVKTLADAKELYYKGDKGTLALMRECLVKLVALYPAHIEIEDKHFFIPVMKYFSDAEQAKMISDFAEFDRKIIHTEYQDVVKQLKEDLIRNT